MPAFAAFTSAERTRVQSFLSDECDAAGRPGADLYAGNCAGCHGPSGGGGRNGLGVAGPDIRCAAGDYREAVRFGEEGMPSFPALSASDVTAIESHVATGVCSSD
jgi:mono/diheme cytochrome c family protein